MCGQGPPLQCLRQLGLLAGPSSHSLPAGMALGPPQPPGSSLVTQQWPQAPEQGLFRCRDQEQRGAELWPDLPGEAEESAGQPPGTSHAWILPDSLSEGPQEQLVQEKGRFISINTPALTHTPTPLLPMNRWVNKAQ